MNALQKALVNAGLAETPKERKINHRKYNCRKCGAPMIYIDNTNVMSCSSCKNYYLFGDK